MVVSDARRDEVFLGQFEVHGGRCEEIGPESIVSRGQLLQVVTAHPGCLVVSPLKGFTIEGVPLLEEPLLAAGLLLAESSRAPYSVGEVALVEPNYVRGVSAKTIEERRGEERGLTLC
jgi:hypothetical protein